MKKQIKRTLIVEYDNGEKEVFDSPEITRMIMEIINSTEVKAETNVFKKLLIK